MIRTLLALPAAVFAFVSALWLHELTHAAAARALGADVLRVDLAAGNVDYRWPEPSPVRDRLVKLAPAIVGLVTLPLMTLLWTGQLTIEISIAAISWVFYTLNGDSEGELRLTSTASEPTK